METEQQIKEEYDIWKNNTHLLYIHVEFINYLIDMIL